jgi:hypothetical protein
MKKGVTRLRLELTGNLGGETVSRNGVGSLTDTQRESPGADVVAANGKGCDTREGVFPSIIPARGEGGRAVAIDGGGTVESDKLKRLRRYMRIWIANAVERKDRRRAQRLLDVLSRAVERAGHR